MGLDRLATTLVVLEVAHVDASMRLIDVSPVLVDVTGLLKALRRRHSPSSTCNKPFAPVLLRSCVERESLLGRRLRLQRYRQAVLIVTQPEGHLRETTLLEEELRMDLPEALFLRRAALGPSWLRRRGA